MEAVLRNGRLIWINGAGKGYVGGELNEYVPIPDQDVSCLFEWDDDGDGEWKMIGHFKDLELYDSEEEWPKSIQEQLSAIRDRVEDLEKARDAANPLSLEGEG